MLLAVDHHVYSQLYVCVAAALRELREGLRDALLLELQPGEQFWQESSVVLLRGQLLCTGRAQTVPLQQLPGVAVKHLK